MNPINADYFDGKSARRTAATIRVVGDIVVVAHGGTSSEYPLPAVRVQSQLKGAPRRIEFPDGSAAVTDDHAGVGAAFGAVSTHTLAHRLESHPGFVITALVGVVAERVRPDAPGGRDTRTSIRPRVTEPPWNSAIYVPRLRAKTASNTLANVGQRAGRLDPKCL